MRSLALAAMASLADEPEERSGVLDAARSGDLAAFERMMQQYERLVLVTALRLSGNLSDALKIPLVSPGGKGVEYTDSGIDQDVDVKEGQKVVVGRSSLEGPQKALFLILTAHVIQ